MMAGTGLSPWGFSREWRRAGGGWAWEGAHDRSPLWDSTPVLEGMLCGPE